MSPERSLLIALGFKLAEHWTVGVYKAQKDSQSGKMNLQCVAHHRSTKVELKDARSWPEGIGVAGAAYTRASEIIVPDLAAPELGSLYNLGALEKKDGEIRYRSIAAVPILVGSGKVPWGVAVATSDDPGHFQIENRDGIHPAEAVRALAGMVALAVATASLSSGARVSQDRKLSPSGMQAGAGGSGTDSGKIA